MGTVIVYSPDGDCIQLDYVDAREYVQHCGYSYDFIAKKPDNEAVSNVDKPKQET